MSLRFHSIPHFKNLDHAPTNKQIYGYFLSRWKNSIVERETKGMKHGMSSNYKSHKGEQIVLVLIQ